MQALAGVIVLCSWVLAGKLMKYWREGAGGGGGNLQCNSIPLRGNSNTSIRLTT